MHNFYQKKRRSYFSQILSELSNSMFLLREQMPALLFISYFLKKKTKTKKRNYKTIVY